MILITAQIGDVVQRNRRFTDSFVEGEEHTVERITSCGQYIWVHGHRHKVPTKYFKLVRRADAPFNIGDSVTFNNTLGAPVRKVLDVKVIRGVWCIKLANNPAQGFVHASGYKLVQSVQASQAPELTDFSDTPKPSGGRTVGDNPHGCGLVANTEPTVSDESYKALTGYRKFKVGDDVKSLNSNLEFTVQDISECGYKFRAKDWTIRYGWMLMCDFELVDSELVNRDIVAGLLLQGVDMQFRKMDEWFDVNPNNLTVGMIGRLDFRVKPLVFDYYGNQIPTPIDVTKTKVKTVWGISLNNNKIYPCALGTARVNKSKGHGLYWETESAAQQAFDVVMKPFNGVTK